MAVNNNNILIGNPGIAGGQSDTIAIGDGTQTACYVAGIYGNSIGSTNALVSIDSNNKLGTVGGASGVFGSLSFLAYLGTTASNVTGDSTVYYLGSTQALTANYNNSGGAFFVGDGAGTGTSHAAYFQAPATGTYFFQVILNMQIGSPSTGTVSDGTLSVSTPSGDYETTFDGDAFGDAFLGDQLLLVSVETSLVLNEKAYFKYRISRDTPSKVDGAYGQSSPYVTYICGYRTN